MHSIHNTLRCLPLGIAIKSALLALGSLVVAVPTVYAASEQQRHYTIPAGTLTAVLNEFAMQADVLFSADAEVTDGLKSSGLAGTYTVEQGFKTLLAPHGLDIQLTSQGYKLIKKQISSPRDLGQLKGINVVATGTANRGDGTVQLPVIVVSATEDSYTVKSDNSATGMNLSLKDTPQSISVITSKRIQDQQLNNLVDVMKNATGVQVTSGEGDIGNARFFSRGYQIKNYQVDGSLSAYFTDTYTSYFAGQESIDTALYDSVSIVRGATGLLTGAGDPSGSINLVRKKPTKDFQASFEVQTGRWDKYRGALDIAGGLNEDSSIRGRFIAVHNQGGYFHPLLDKDASTLYGVVEADLGDSTVISASWERSEAENNGGFDIKLGDVFTAGNSALSTHNRYTWQIADWSKYKQNRDNFTLTLNHHFNDSWKLDATYNYVKDDNKIKLGTCLGGWYSNDACNTDEFHNDEYDNKAHTIDLKLNGQFSLWGQTHDLAFGFNGLEKKSDQILFDAEAGSYKLMKLVNNRLIVSEPIWTRIKRNNKTDITQYGAFISTRLNFTDDFSAILGGRYSEWETKEERWFRSIGTTIRKADNFLPYLALTYDLTNNLKTYASYTEIFNPQSARDRDGSYLDPETGFNYELGLKGEWFDGRLNSSFALFQSGKDNLAVTDRDGNGVCYTISGTTTCASKALDDTKNKGWEFEIAGKITPNWQVQTGFSQSILRDSDGERLDDLPIRTANLFTTYQALPELTLGGGLRWQSRTSIDSQENMFIAVGRPRGHIQDDFYIVDLMANYEFNPNLSLHLNLNNALDKEYRTDTLYYKYGEQRNWLATLKYKF